MTTTTTEAHGKCRWLEPCPVTGCLRLRIITGIGARKHTTDYDVEQVKGGFDLWRLDPVTFTLVCRKVRLSIPWTCDCEDATHRRPGKCRHVCALKVAIQKLPF